FETLGARKSASTSLETAMVWAQIVNTKFDATLDLFHELLLTPTFPNDELEQMRSLILQEIRRRDDEPMHRIFDLVRADFYRGSALFCMDPATTESVSDLRRQDLREFWRERYRPNDVIFSIAGKFDWDHVVEKMQTLFADWTGQATPSPKQEPNPTNSISLEFREGKQEHLALMAPFPRYTDPDYYAAMVIAEVLGGNMA